MSKEWNEKVANALKKKMKATDYAIMNFPSDSIEKGSKVHCERKVLDHLLIVDSSSSHPTE